VIQVENGGVTCRERFFVSPLNQSSAGVMEFTISNSLSEPAEAFLQVVFSDPRNGGKPVKMESDAQGWRVSGEHGLLAQVRTMASAPLTVAAQEGVLKLTGKLPANSSAQCVLLLPTEPKIPVDVLDPVQLRAATEAYWNTELASAMQIETPDPLLNNAIRSSQVRCLIDARSEADGARVAAWIAAVSYGPLESESHSVIRGMDFMGHPEFARRSLDYFVHRYNTNGFLTTGYTTFGTAWHLWMLAEHYQLTHDTNWLRQVAPEIARVGHWIIRQTDKTKKLAPQGNPLPEFGLMPPGVLADWNSFAYHFAMNAYYYAALHGLGEVLEDIGHPDAKLLKQQADELKKNTLHAYAWTQSRARALPLRDGTWIPYYPSQVHSPGKLGEFFPGQDAGRSWCYDVELGAHQLVPTGILAPNSREVSRLMDHMEDVQFLADGWFDYPYAANHQDWFNLGGFSKVQPYYTRNAEIYALRDDVKPFVRSYFNSLAAMLNPEVLTLWEHFHHSGAWDKTHETGYFLHQTRTMLVQERGHELWLAPFITDQWLKDGARLSVKQAPTRWGSLGYEIHSHLANGYIEATVMPPIRSSLQAIVLRLRHPESKPIRSVTVNGQDMRHFDAENGTVSFQPAPSGPMTIKVVY
jgi:hypothetical protein